MHVKKNLKYFHVNQLNDDNRVYYLVGRKSIILETKEQLQKEWLTAKEGYVIGTQKNPTESGSHRNVIQADNSDIGMILTQECLAGPAIKLPDKSLEYEYINHVTI